MEVALAEAARDEGIQLLQIDAPSLLAPQRRLQQYTLIHRATPQPRPTNKQLLTMQPVTRICGSTYFFFFCRSKPNSTRVSMLQEATVTFYGHHLDTTSALKDLSISILEDARSLFAEVTDVHCAVLFIFYVPR